MEIIRSEMALRTHSNQINTPDKMAAGAISDGMSIGDRPLLISPAGSCLLNNGRKKAPSTSVSGHDRSRSPGSACDVLENEVQGCASFWPSVRDSICLPRPRRLYISLIRPQINGQEGDLNVKNPG